MDSPPLTDAVKDQILGLNAARLFGIDPKSKRQAVKADRHAESERRRLLDENTHLRLELKEKYEEEEAKK